MLNASALVVAVSEVSSLPDVAVGLGIDAFSFKLALCDVICLRHSRPFAVELTTDVRLYPRAIF
jgi:hypothetical protein